MIKRSAFQISFYFILLSVYRSMLANISFRGCLSFLSNSVRSYWRDDNRSRPDFEPSISNTLLQNWVCRWNQAKPADTPAVWARLYLINQSERSLSLTGSTCSVHRRSLVTYIWCNRQYHVQIFVDRESILSQYWYLSIWSKILWYLFCRHLQTFTKCFWGLRRIRTCNVYHNIV